MARNKTFNVLDLYPTDYCFDYEAFEAEPESYVFTLEDIAYLNAMELERYEQEAPMSCHEKEFLRKWVMSGHSPERTQARSTSALQAQNHMISLMSIVWIGRYSGT